jgi:hypothetical protein
MSGIGRAGKLYSTISGLSTAGKLYNIMSGIGRAGKLYYTISGLSTAGKLYYTMSGLSTPTKENNSGMVKLKKVHFLDGISYQLIRSCKIIDGYKNILG